MPTPGRDCENSSMDTRWSAEPGSSARSVDLRPETVSLEGKRALVVEDSWHIAFATKSLLENAGMVVMGPVAQADAAETLLAAATPDVAVIDVNLHGTLALGLVDRLNALRIPIVVVSGYEMVDALEGKISVFLKKPVRSRVLMAAVRSQLCQPR